MRQTALVVVALVGIVGGGAVLGDPPKNLKIVLEAERAEYFVGEPVVLKFGITNVSEKYITVGAGGDYRFGTRAARFVVTAVDEKGVEAEDPDPVQANMGGIGGDIGIHPGETKWMPVFPMRYRVIDHAGMYRIRVSHDLRSEEKSHNSKMPAVGDMPTGEITLRFKMPNEEEARKIVDGLVALKEESWTMIDSSRVGNDLARDFGTLRLPVYLKALAKYAEAGEVGAVDGIGSIETPEATKALVELLKSPTTAVVQEIAWPLNKRIPGMSVFPNAFSGRVGEERSLALVKATWRPEFAAGIRAYAAGELKSPKNTEGGMYYDTLGVPARFLEVLGEKEDAPAVFDAIDRALTLNEHLVRRSELEEPRNAGPLLRAGVALLRKGAAMPSRERFCAAALEVDRIRWEKAYRPARWEETLVTGLGDSRAYIRRVALQTLAEIPEAMPEGAKVKLVGMLKDGDEYVVQAAVLGVGKSGDRELGLELLEFLRGTKDETLLRLGCQAMVTLPIRAEWLEMCAARLAEAGDWAIFYDPLFRVLGGLTGGGSYREPSVESVAPMQKLWVEFVSKHREEIAAGKKVPLEQAEAGLVPPSAKYLRIDGGEWPAR